MKLNYSHLTANGIKALLAGLFLLGTLAVKSQCIANFTYTLGANGSVSLTSISSGTNVSSGYSWTFGGGAIGVGSSTSHTYTTNGYKYICLTMVSSSLAPSCTNTKCDSVLITNSTTPPTATCNANFNYVLGPNGLVSFISTSTGTTISSSYSWNLYWSPGGSASASGQSSAYTFTSNGAKIICLSLNSNTTVPGACTSSKCDTIMVTSVTVPTTSPCAANFSITQGSNGAVSFVSTSTGTSVSTNYSWSFYPGTGTGSSITRTYSTNGQKTICLTITNSVTGCTSTKCDSIVVTSVAGSVTPCAPSVVYTLSKDSLMPLTWNAYPSYPANVTNATWSWGDGSTTIGLYPSHSYSAAGTYSTCVTISVSCGTITATYCYVAGIFKSSENNDMILLNVKQATPTGIKNYGLSENNLSIYPNPTNGNFTLELSGNAKDSKVVNVSVYNMLGEKVLEQQTSAASKHNVDVSALSNGTYFVKVLSEKGLSTKKIMVQK